MDSSDQSASFGLASCCEAKGCQFDSWSGHMPRLWVWSPVGACMRGNWSMALSHISASLPLFLPLSLIHIHIYMYIHIYIYFKNKNKIYMDMPSNPKQLWKRKKAELEHYCAYQDLLLSGYRHIGHWNTIGNPQIDPLTVKSFLIKMSK